MQYLLQARNLIISIPSVSQDPKAPTGFSKPLRKNIRSCLLTNLNQRNAIPFTSAQSNKHSKCQPGAHGSHSAASETTISIASVASGRQCKKLLNECPCTILYTPKLNRTPKLSRAQEYIARIRITAMDRNQQSQLQLVINVSPEPPTLPT